MTGVKAACRKLNVGWFLTQQNRWASGILSGLPTQPIIRVYLPRRQAAFRSEKRPSEYWYSASRSLHTYRVRGCATHPTCELCGTLKPMCRVCAVRTHAVAWLTVCRFNFSDDLLMSSESISFNKVKTLNNKPFPSQHPNHKQKSYGALSQKLHCQRHILFHRQTRRLKIAPACRKYRLIACSLYGCVKNNIPLKPSPYACCRTISTPFGCYD